MTHDQQRDELTEEEVERVDGEPLPEREAMMVLRPPLPVVEPITPGYGIDPPPPEEA
jgi:hypothetical protein